jgi:hypothetical protein
MAAPILVSFSVTPHKEISFLKAQNMLGVVSLGLRGVSWIR